MSARTLLYSAANLWDSEYRAGCTEAARLTRLSQVQAKRELNEKLFRYLQYCRTYSRYWRDRWPGEANDFGPEEALDVLRVLPRIGKDELRSVADDLHIQPDARQRADGWPAIENQHEQMSGGSTGLPVKLWQDKRWGARNRAVVDASYRLTGLEPGAPTFYLWGSMNELSDMKKSLRKRASTWLRNLIPLPAFSLGPERVREYAETIRKRSDVESAVCFVSALDTFTGLAERHGIALRRLRRVIAGGGMLHAELRQRVQRVWADEVYDLYGARDTGLMAMQSPGSTGLRTFPWFNYVEVLDDRGMPCAPGVKGIVHITALENHSTALLRFSTGDAALVDQSSDEWFSVLANLVGRTAEHLVGRGGSRIDPSAVIHLIGVVYHRDWLKKFQLSQLSLDCLEVSIEVWHTPPPHDLHKLQSELITAFSTLFGCAIHLRILVVDHIPPAPSGKHLYCASVLADESASPVSAPDVSNQYHVQ